MKTGVYQIRNLVNNKCYIGSAAAKQGFKKRWNEHVCLLMRGCHRNLHLQRAWNKHHADNFVFEIREECQPDQCLIREQHYLDVEKPEYNIALNAQSPMLGRKHTKATKAIMSKKASGSCNPMYGRPVTDEHRRRLSKARLGKKFSKEHRENLARSIGKLNENDVLKIRQDLIHGVTTRELFESYGVTKSCIMSIKHRRTWRHI